MKLRQEVYKNDTLRKATDYIGSLILENDTLQFIQTAEGRVVPKNVDGVDKNEYQYHLKDHLGNVRSTFAVRDDDYATGFETATNPYFDNYDEITILSNPLKKSGTYAHRLTGGGTNIVGLMKKLYVSKGDRIRAEVYAKYLDAQFTNDGINGAALINALVSMLGGGTLTGEGTVIENNLNTDFISAAMADGSQESSPKAYLNYILLDKNFNYLNSGFERLGSSAADPGDGSGTHQKLSFEEILVQEDGYLMVFLSNESDQSVEVFWDDFRVDHHYNAVLQADDYYPFGLTFNSYQRSYSKANNFKYNGKEEQEETGWLDYGARMYMPDLGRWNGVDIMAEKYFDNSPYNYVANMPTIAIDPNGMEIVILGDDDYKKQVWSYLLNLAKESDKGKELFYETIFSDKQFVVADLKSETDIGLDEYKDYSVISFNLADANGEYEADNGRNGGKLKYTAESKLAHEMSHFLNEQSGMLLDENGYSTNIRSSEAKAVEDENIVRKQMGMAERTHYGGINVYGKGIKESSKYQGWYNLSNKKGYGSYSSSSSYSGSDIQLVNKKRQTYKYNGTYIEKYFVKSPPTHMWVARKKKKD